MSRVGQAPIPVPSGVEVKIEGRLVTVKGPKGELTRDLPEVLSITQDEGELTVARADEERESRALHGLFRSLVANMVTGVTEGYRRGLEIVGVGYRATAQGDRALELAVGYSHTVKVAGPRRHHLRGALQHPHRRRRHRQGDGRPGGRRHPRHPQARALQGQGHPLPGRGRPPQGRQGRLRRLSNEGTVMAPHRQEGQRPGSGATVASARRSRARPSGRAWPSSGRTGTSASRSSTTAPGSRWPRPRPTSPTCEGDATGNKDAAAKVGQRIAERAKAAGITTVVFDRGGNLYHGRVAAVADAAREGGLEF